MKRVGWIFALSLCFVSTVLAAPPPLAHGVDINQTSKAFVEYLHDLGVLTIAFVGFAGLYLGSKERQAGKATPFDVMLTRNHYTLSFIVVGAALLPPLLALAPSKQFSWEMALRVASGIAAIPLLVFCIGYPKWRYQVTGVPMPTGTKVILGLFYVVVALLLINAFVVGSPALYAFALTVQQFTNIFTFIYALRYVLEIPNAP